MAKVSMEAWITGALTDGERGRCTAMALMHRTGNSDTEVYGIKLSEGGQWNPAKIAKTFNAKAEVHSQEAHTPQLFNICAYYETSVEAQARFPFRVQGGADEGGDFTEDATPKGQIQQQMRLGEVTMKTGIGAMQFMIGQQTELITELLKNNRLLMNENHEATIMAKTVILEAARNQHEHRMAEIKAMQSAKFWEGLTRLAPAGINALAGREVIPLAAEDSSTIEALIEAVNENPEIVDYLATKLPPALMGLIARRAAMHNTQKSEAENFARRAIGSKNGEADAAGG